MDNYFAIGVKNWGLIAILLLLTLATKNPVETFAAVLFLILTFKLLFRKNEPPILFLAIVLQWLQVCIKVFYANFYSESFTSVYEFPDHIKEAYYLSLLGL